MSTHSSERTVFVVDDNIDVRDGLKALLESIGLRCQTFSSSREFLQYKTPDEESCLVLDIRLPGASGLDLQADLASANINIPIIFLTGHGDIPMSVRAMRAGAVEFLTKPVREQDLLDAVNSALERSRSRRKQEETLHQLRSRYDRLNQREREVMSFVTAGLMNKEAAAEMGLSEITVKVNRHSLMQKMEAKSLPELVRMVDTLGIVVKSGK
jgi:FixJ family two-component response regulator